MAVERADNGHDAFTVVKGNSVVALAFSIDIGLVTRADGVTEPLVLLEARFAETSIAVAVIVIARWAVSTNSLNADILLFADASLCGIRIILIGSLAWDDIALLCVFTVGFSRLALRADTLHNVIVLSTVTFASVEVVDLVCSALYSADSLVDVIELASWALGAEIVDQVVPRFANAPILDPVLIDCANGGADSIAALSACFLVAVDAVTALVLLVVELGIRVTDTAHASDKVIAWQASAGTDGGVPNFVDFARSVADTIGSIVDLSGRANSTRVSNQVVSSLALAGSVLPFFIGIASISAKTQVQKVSLIAHTSLGDGIIG